MDNLKTIKNILTKLAVVIDDPEAIIAKYNNILRYLISFINKNGFNERKLSEYIDDNYPSLDEDLKRYLGELAGKNYKNDKFLQRLFHSNTSNKDTVKLSKLELNKILTGLKSQFQKVISSQNIQEQEHALKELTPFVLELEKTVKALSDGLENNQLVELQ